MSEDCCDLTDYAAHICLECGYQHCHCPGGTPGPLKNSFTMYVEEQMAAAWDEGYNEGALDNKENYGRKVRWGTAKNPYR